MGGDDTAGGDPEDLPEAHLLCQSLGLGADGVFEPLGVDEDQDLLRKMILLGELLQKLDGHLVHLAAILLRGLELTVQNLDQGIQGQDLGAQIGGVADPSAGPEIIQIPGNKAHPCFPGNDLCGLCSSFQRMLMYIPLVFFSKASSQEE